MSIDLLTPITIRGLTLETRILQAPLAGYSDWPFRLACWKHGRPGLLATEMISALSASMSQNKTKSYLIRHPEEGVLQYQIWGREPEHIGVAARLCAEAGASCIDLNCGCPARKITSSGCGVAIMREPVLVGKCVAAMRHATDLPISIKTRIGPTRDNWNGLEVLRAAQEEGADFATLHGRHGQESYATAVRMEEMAKIISQLRIPIIGNGDVFDGPSAKRLVEHTGCVGVMVGRGCMGQPWVFDKIKCELSGRAWTPLPIVERGRIMLENYNWLVEFMGEDRATCHMRKLAAFYSKSIAGSCEFRHVINSAKTAEEFLSLVHSHFGC